MTAQVSFNADAAVRAEIASAGRTEDVRFSPDNALMALAGYGRNRCLLLAVTIAGTAQRPTISCDDFMELRADCIGELHGVDFIDERTLALANRDGRVAIVRIPAGAPGGRRCEAEVLRVVRGSPFCRIKTPGSLAVRQEGRGMVGLYVCNNYVDRVSHHALARAAGYRSVRNRTLVDGGIVIPDGIALSDDGMWMAISSHGTHDVRLYRLDQPRRPGDPPEAILSGAGYPHGIRFTGDGAHLLVADAGGPLVNVYDRGAGWEGTRPAARTVTVLDKDAFARGHNRPDEGGPKGLDIDRTGRLVAVTCEEQTLAFFPLGAFIANRPEAERRHEDAHIGAPAPSL